MRRIPAALFSIFVSCIPSPSWPGAWTLDRGQTQIISGITLSRASKDFDGAGRPTQDVSFDKNFSGTYFEYGLTDDVTLFGSPEYVSAQSQIGNGPTASARSFAMEAGVRILLFAHIGMLSIQGSGKSAGLYDMYCVGSTYSKEPSGRRAELRLLYGTSFKFLGRDGFIDLQAAERWINRPRPDETVLDATAGLRLWPGTLMMVQSFNTQSAGGGDQSYAAYRQHKFEVSVVQRITDRWSLQIGGFSSPIGQNVVAEQGIVVSVWDQF
jgi:hypothetical protein